MVEGSKMAYTAEYRKKSIKTQTHNQNIGKIDRYYLDGLKEENAKTESACTRPRRKLLGLMELELPP